MCSQGDFKDLKEFREESLCSYPASVCVPIFWRTLLHTKKIFDVTLSCKFNRVLVGVIL